jgi:hypothetical protein
MAGRRLTEIVELTGSVVAGVGDVDSRGGGADKLLQEDEVGLSVEDWKEMEASKTYPSDIGHVGHPGEEDCLDVLQQGQPGSPLGGRLPRVSRLWGDLRHDFIGDLGHAFVDCWRHTTFGRLGQYKRRRLLHLTLGAAPGGSRLDVLGVRSRDIRSRLLRVGGRRVRYTFPLGGRQRALGDGRRTHPGGVGLDSGSRRRFMTRRGAWTRQERPKPPAPRPPESACWKPAPLPQGPRRQL